jgi:hypothetical protein
MGRARACKDSGKEVENTFLLKGSHLEFHLVLTWGKMMLCEGVTFIFIKCLTYACSQWQQA